MLAWFDIVCGVDFSATSRPALEHSADLARRLGAKLTLLHVWHGPAEGREPRGAAPAAARDVEAELARELEGWKREAERITGRDVEAVVRRGAPAAEIGRFAEERKADLVVVGTRGRTGLERAVLGSVAEAVVRHAPCAVLVAREQDRGD
jgi:nucleotide-binding universal stress UspA family protein